MLSKYRTINLPDYTLLDSTASVHVFHKKERFEKFKRVGTDQGLQCGNDIISIKGWGEVTLALKTRACTLLLTFKQVTFIANFPLNLVSLAGLEDKGFDWTHKSGELTNRKTQQVIGHTVQQGKNYKIVKATKKAMGMAFTILATKEKLCFKHKATCRYHPPQSTQKSPQMEQHLAWFTTKSLQTKQHLKTTKSP